MSKLGLKQLYLPSNLNLEIKKFTNGYIIWFSGFMICWKKLFLQSISFEMKSNQGYLNPSLNKKYCNYYFLQSNTSTKISSQKSSLLYTELKQNIMAVLVGYKKILNLRGVGYKFKLEKNILFIEVGYSHMLSFLWPRSFKVKFSRKSKGIQVRGNNLMLLMSFLAKIKSVRPTNIYTRKGIRYRKEIIKHKEGKKKKSF